MKQFLLISALVLGMACGSSTKHSEAKISADVEANVAQRRANFWEQCHLTALERASDHVDSLLLSRAYQSILDSAKAPLRPDRPEQLPIDIVSDTTPLKPIIAKEEK